MNKEEIENMIKSKYKDLKIKESLDISHTFKFNFEKYKEKKWIKWEEITLNIKEKNKIFYEEKGESNYEFYNYNKTYKRFEIENNAIELKHLLDIKITEEDITNWLLSIGFEKEDNYYFKSNKDYWLVYKDKKIYQNYTDIECYSLPTFEVENSNDYWRLYNIIINLID